MIRKILHVFLGGRWHEYKSQSHLDLSESSEFFWLCGNKMCIFYFFRPFLETELAVGVKKGVIVWQMESTSALKPGVHCAQLLSIPGHGPVTCVQYSYSVSCGCTCS